jgi:hypothetical protein
MEIFVSDMPDVDFDEINEQNMENIVHELENQQIVSSICSLTYTNIV